MTPHHERLATIELDADTDLVITVDAIGRLDLREWTKTGDLKFPSRSGVAAPRAALTALIAALRKAQWRDAA